MKKLFYLSVIPILLMGIFIEKEVDNDCTVRRIHDSVAEGTHQFDIPGGGRIFYDIGPAGSGEVVPIVGEASESLLDREEIQTVVIPAVTAALAAWAKVGSGRFMDKTTQRPIKLLADGVAVYAAMNALMSVADKYNVVFVTESSEGKKDNSFYIPMGTIITPEGYISPELCRELHGSLPYTIGDVLEILQKCGQEKPKYIIAINYDPIENTNAHIKGKKGSYSVMGATFYPVTSDEDVQRVKSAKIHYIPDKGFYLAGFSWNSPDVGAEEFDIWDNPSEVLKEISKGDLSSFSVAFLGERSRHNGIKADLSSLGVRMITPPDGDAILRLFSESGGIPGIGPLFTCGASGTSEAAIAFKAAMIFNDAHALFTYVPSSVNEGDLLEFLQTKKGAEKFTQSQIDQLEELGISPTHYLGQFTSDKAYLPEGAFNIVVFAPITGANPEYLGEQASALLPGVHTSFTDSPDISRGKVGIASDIYAQALVAVRFPEDSDGRLFTINLPYSTSNLGAWVGFIDNVLFPKVAQMATDPETRRNVIPPILPER